MIDFKATFKQGLAAAQQSAKNKLEIKEVFAELNRQLDEASDGKISVQVEDIINPNSAVQSTMTAVTARHRVFTAIKPRILARCFQHNAGYPFRLVFDNEDISCENREALELELSNLLGTTPAGQVLHALMTYQPLPQELAVES